MPNRRFQLGVANQTRVFWSVLALLSIVFHVGLAAVHCHDLEGYQGKVGLGIERFQEAPSPQPADDDEGSCVICQLLSVFKGTAPQNLSAAGSAFAGLILLIFSWQTFFVTRPRSYTGRPRAPPRSNI